MKKIGCVSIILLLFSLLSVFGSSSLRTEKNEDYNKNVVKLASQTNSSSTIVHSFTDSGKTSSVFSITGNLSSSKGSITVDGKEQTVCLKMESSTKITFSLSESGTINLYMGNSKGNDVKIDGEKVTGDSSRIITEELSAGNHTITKASVAFLFYIELNGTTSSGDEPIEPEDPQVDPEDPEDPEEPSTGGDVVDSKSIFVSTNGSSSNNGDQSHPTTLQKAISNVSSGGTIYMLGGTYNYSSTILISSSGSSGNLKKIKAYNNASVVLNFSGQSVSSSNRGIVLNANYWHFYGIDIKNAGDNGMLLSGHNNIIEMCRFYNNQDSGLQLSRYNTSYDSLSQWPSNNLIKNCTSMNNCDEKTMENADGFAAKLTCGNGNVFDGCIAYNNSDDGWDLYAKSETGPIGVVTIKNCISFRNGRTEDGKGGDDCDGNGFKLGGAGVGTAHVVTNCIAFENLHHGFTDNNNPKFSSMKNCTSYNNSTGGGKANFQMNRITSSTATFSGLLSIAENGECASDKIIGKISNSVIYNSSKYYKITSQVSINNSKAGSETSGPTSSDFNSMSAPSKGTNFHTYWRNSSGSIDLNGFLEVKSSSSFSGMGAEF